MANVFDVAEYILSKLGATATLKLHKLVFYCQAWSLAWDGMPLFEEEIEVKMNSFICPELYKAHRGVFIVDAGYFKSYITEGQGFEQDSLETMDSVLLEFGDKPLYMLNELTHMENPWRFARYGLAPGQLSNCVVSKDSMQVYFAGILGGKL